jgi:aryl-alcohol dehydrogenase-like predicted oxidoreductase
VALNWLLRKPTVSSLIIGARNADQLKANLAAASFVLTPEQVEKLDLASQRPLPYPYWHQRQFANRNPAPPSYR